MTERQIRNAAIHMAVNKALLALGLETIRREPFFGMNETSRQETAKAA